MGSDAFWSFAALRVLLFKTGACNAPAPYEKASRCAVPPPADYTECSALDERHGTFESTGVWNRWSRRKRLDQAKIGPWLAVARLIIFCLPSFTETGLDRTVGRDREHRDSGGHAVAGVEQGQAARAPDPVHGSSITGRAGSPSPTVARRSGAGVTSAPCLHSFATGAWRIGWSRRTTRLSPGFNTAAPGRNDGLALPVILLHRSREEEEVAGGYRLSILWTVGQQPRNDGA